MRGTGAYRPESPAFGPARRPHRHGGGGRRTASAPRPALPPPRAVLFPAALGASLSVQAQGDLSAQDWARQQAAAEIWGLLLLFALAALGVHLAQRMKGRGPLRERVRSLAFLASTYLAGFFFLASVSGVARFLRLFGLDREISSLVALPLGLVVAYKIYTAYEKWRTPK